MPIRTSLAALRATRGFSAAELARRVDVSRQTIYAIEDGSFVPNTAVALRLARVLDVGVEEIFALDEPAAAETAKAELLDYASGSAEDGQLVRLCRVNERLVAVPVPQLPTYLPRADGTIAGKSGTRVSVHPAADVPQDGKRLLLAGCDPALSLLAEALRPSGIDVIGVPCSSRLALEYLKRGRVHAAGSHLRDTASGDYNVPLVRSLFAKSGVRVVTFAVWEEGLVLRRGNPKNIRSIADLADRHVTLMNREKGSGSRDLLDKSLRKAGIAAKSVTGYSTLASGHLAAASAVAMGMADCCVATRSAARRFGLNFVPLAVERFDLTFSKQSLELPAAKAVLDLLNRASLRRKLETIAGYDTAHTGGVLM
jgi:molybdate-binding protein/DNA-binding XRE family transcriptional regulator